MQQYRVNYTLLIGLIIGAFVCSGAIFGLHRYQSARQSGWLLEEADKAHGEKNYRDAVQYYEQYLFFHPEDKETRFKYFNTCLDLTEPEDAEPEDYGRAQQVLEAWLRDPKFADVPEMRSVRRRLALLYGRDNVRNYSFALNHINMLLAGEPKNVELQALRATYLARSANLDEAKTYSFKLIGYDPKSDSFDIKKATAPNSPEVYASLAGILRGRDNKPELASRVANQMVEANPKLADAYVSRGRLLSAWGDTNGARADALKAYQLKPENLDVLLFVTDVAADDKDYDKAHQYSAAAKKLFPKEPRVYRQSALLELQQNKYKEAMAEIDAGVKAVSGSAANNLLFLKARLQISQKDTKAARQSIGDMQQIHKLPPEVVEYFDAIILVAEGDWFHASEALSKLRPRSNTFGRDMVVEIDFDLGLSNEKLARFEQAQDYYEKIPPQASQYAAAMAGVQRMKTRRGLDAGATGGDPMLKLQNAMADELKKPSAEQNWTRIDAMADEIAKAHKLDEPTVKLMKAQVAMLRQDYDAANKLVNEANDLSPKNLRIYRFKVNLARVDPKVGPEKALELLKKVVDQFGDLPELRVDKADILIALNKDKQDKEPLKRDMAGLLSGIDSWTTAQKVDLWREIANRYFTLNMMDEGRQYLALAADNQPHDLPLRLALFSLALEAGDDDGMKAAQDRILQIVGDKNDSAWLYADARHKLWLLRRGQSGPESLDEIRSLVKHALDQRPQWQDLNALAAEVELSSNNMASALKYYAKAEEYGRPSPISVAQHIRLLAATGRYPDAGKLLDRIPEMARQTLLGPLYPEILFRTNQVDAAIQQARVATEADPTSAQNQYWYGQLLARSSQDTKLSEAKRKEKMDQAIAAMQRVTQLNSESPDAWFALINYYLIQKKENEAHKAMRDAQLALSGESLTLFLARSYEMLSRWFDAETMFREIYETDPKDLQRAQQLAAFYLGPVYQRDDKQAKATPLLNQILKAGADGKIPVSDTNLLWARRMAAKMLADTGDYQKMMKARNLLASNSQDGSLLVEDKLAIAEILGARLEPSSRKQAIALLEEVDALQNLNEAAQIQLADLYYATRSDWSKYTSKMEVAVGKYPNSAKVRDSYIRKLLTRNDPASIQRAATLVLELRKIAPDDPHTFELTVRIANRFGKQQQVSVRDQLLRRMPDFSSVRELTAEQKQTLVMYARLFVDLNDLDSAEKIYRDLTARDPKNAIGLATFLGMNRSPEQCFAKLQEVYSPERLSEILDVALGVDRELRDKVGDKFDAQIQQWIDGGLRENPDSTPLLMSQADLRDIQKRYDDAATIYRNLLKKTDLTGRDRAVVLNNVAFLIALSNLSGKSAATDIDPLASIQEASDILGPTADILDTRAVVFISLKRYKDAVQDLDLSLTDSPTASKYFHMAVARMRGGETGAAVDAWRKGEALGLKRDVLNRMEYDLYEQTKAQIDKIRGGPVTKAEPPRKAG